MTQINSYIRLLYLKLLDFQILYWILDIYRLCKVYHVEIVLAHLSHYFSVRLYNKLEPPPDSEATTMDIDDIGKIKFQYMAPIVNGLFKNSIEYLLNDQIIVYLNLDCHHKCDIAPLV